MDILLLIGYPFQSSRGRDIKRLIASCEKIFYQLGLLIRTAVPVLEKAVLPISSILNEILLILVLMLYPEITSSLPNPALAQIFLTLDTKQGFSESV